MNMRIRSVGFFRQSAHVAAVLVSLAAAQQTHAEAPRLLCYELRRLQLIKTSSLILIDVRPPGDFAKGHIQGAANIPSSSVGGAKISRSAKIIVYCGENSCPLSSSAAAKLISLGYKDVSLLDGGFTTWMNKGYPAQTGMGTTQKPTLASIPTAEAQKKINDKTMVVLDVRTPLEFSAGHLPGALNLSLESLNSAVANLPKDEEFLIYDSHAGRSRQAAQKLLDSGFKVVELAGGLAGWIKMKLPLETK